MEEWPHKPKTRAPPTAIGKGRKEQLIQFDAARTTLDSTPIVAPAKPSKAERRTWNELVSIEPRLLALYRAAKAIRDNKGQPSFCANRVWYGVGHQAGFKERLCRLVGYDASDPRLQTSAAYDVAYHKVYSALPDCRNCSCFGLSALIER